MMKTAFKLIIYSCSAILFIGCSNLQLRDTKKVEKTESYHTEKASQNLLENLLRDELHVQHHNGQIETNLSNIYPILNLSSNPELHADDKYEQLVEIVGNTANAGNPQYALNLSRYLTDNQYLCERPLFARYFQERYHEPYNTCVKDVPFRVISKEVGSKLIWLDPKRVSDIHILFIDNGEALVSNFGHISVRFVVCPEDDNSKGACDANLYEHIVLSYRAHVNELTINTLKGLLGDYRAYLFAENFMDVHAEYSVGEFRDIYSLPIKLNASQREDIVRFMSEIHWGYTGTYKFFTNNCSTLMQKFFLFVLNEFAENEHLQELYLRPDNFFNAIKQTDFVDSKKLADLLKAEEEGYYFPNSKHLYENALKKVLASMEQPPFNDLDEYTYIAPLVKYGLIIEDVEYYKHLIEDKKLYTSQLLLEQLSLLQYERIYASSIANYFEANGMENIRESLEKVFNKNEFQRVNECILRPIEAVSKPIVKTEGIQYSDVFEGPMVVCGAEDHLANQTKLRKSLAELDEDNWLLVEAAMSRLIQTMKIIEKLLETKH